MAMIVERREAQLRQELPELYDTGGPLWGATSMLYIGANAEMATGLRDWHEAGWVITVVEVWPPFLRQLHEGPLAGLVDAVVEGDVRYLERLPLEKQYDVTIWYHGPEHIEYNDFQPCVRKLEAMTSRLVVLGAPWGDTLGTGLHEYASHVSMYTEADFWSIGYQTATQGELDAPDGNLMGWKWL